MFNIPGNGEAKLYFARGRGATDTQDMFKRMPPYSARARNVWKWLVCPGEWS